MRRAAPLLAGLLLLPGPSGAGDLSTAIIEKQERILVAASLLITGPEGAITAAEERAEIPTGTAGQLSRAIDLAAAGGPSEPLEVLLSVTGRAVDEVHLELAVASRVRLADGTSHERVRRERIVEGGSLLMEIFGTDELSPRRVFAILEARSEVAPIVRRAGPDTRPVDLLLEVSHRDGDRSQPLEQVRMSTLTGRAVDYAFRLSLPAETLGMEPGQGLRPVGVTLRVLPVRLPDGEVELTVTLLDPGGRPWTDGEPLRVTHRRALAPGESVILDLSTRTGALTYRFSVTPYF